MGKYFRIPQCPKCQSWRTGRYINSFSLSNREIAYFYRKGELVKPSFVISHDKITKMYCEDCGAEWEGYIEPVNLTYEEIEKEKEKRKINYDTVRFVKKYKSKNKKSFSDKASQKLSKLFEVFK